MDQFLILNSLSIVSFIVSVIMAGAEIEGWGWFLFVSVICFSTPTS